MVCCYITMQTTDYFKPSASRWPYISVNQKLEFISKSLFPSHIFPFLSSQSPHPPWRHPSLASVTGIYFILVQSGSTKISHLLVPAVTITSPYVCGVFLFMCVYMCTWRPEVDFIYHHPNTVHLAFGTDAVEYCESHQLVYTNI